MSNFYWFKVIFWNVYESIGNIKLVVRRNGSLIGDRMLLEYFRIGRDIRSYLE